MALGVELLQRLLVICGTEYHMIIYLSRTLATCHICKGCACLAADTCQHFVKFLVCCQLPSPTVPALVVLAICQTLCMTSFAVGEWQCISDSISSYCSTPLPPPLCVCFTKFTYRLAEGLHNEGHSLPLLHSGKWLTIIRLPMGMENH